MTNDFLDGIKSEIRTELVQGLSYWENLYSRTRPTGIRPLGSQAQRIYEVVRNGTKRVLLADSTSAGKTFTTVAIKALLDEKQKRENKVLLVAPGQALQTAWTSEEFNRYCRDMNFRPQAVRLVESESGLENILDDRNFGNVDFVGINYHKFGLRDSRSFEENPYFKKIRDNAHRFDAVVLDECQNFKNSQSNRSRAFKQIIDRTLDKYLIMLSATPGQNGLEDLGGLLHFLDPSLYGFGGFDYRANSTAIKDMKLSGRWFNLDRNDLKELFDLADLVEHDPVFIDIGDAHGKRYLDIWADGDLPIGTKISELNKILLHGKIQALGQNNSSLLEKILAEASQDAGIGVFTYLKTDVQNRLFELFSRLYGKNQVKIISGDTPLSARVKYCSAFSEGDLKVLLNTHCVSEGISMSPGNREVVVLNAQPQINHGHARQVEGRFYRFGQKENVHILNLIAKNPFLFREMTRLVESGELERKYGVRFSQNWSASTLDHDSYRIQRKKDEIDREKLRKGITLSEIDRAIYELRDDSVKSQQDAENAGVFTSLPRGTKNKEDPFIKGIRSAVKLVGIGIDKLREADEGHGPYVKPWKDLVYGHGHGDILNGTPGDTARMLKQVKEGLEEKVGKLSEILDVGCGPGTVARVFEQDMISLDQSSEMLKYAQEAKTPGTLIQALLQKMPFRDNSFNLVTSSYCLFYNQQNSKADAREIEDGLIEINRVLRNNGYVMATLPNQVTKEDDFAKMGEAFNRYGFKVLLNDYFEGRIKTKRGSKKSLAGFYFILAKKTFEVDDYVNSGFDVYVDAGYRTPGAYRLVELPCDSLFDTRRGRGKIRRKVHSDFFVDSRRNKLETLLERVEV